MSRWTARTGGHRWSHWTGRGAGQRSVRDGKSMGRPTTQWRGVVLVFYPYLVPNTGVLYAVGAALCAALHYYRPCIASLRGLSASATHRGTN